METDPLELFSRQIFSWAQKTIDAGRLPFRMVERQPSVITVDGEEHPDLVFWVNRDSCMAGGVLLFPESAAAGVEQGRRCATALGLKHFVVWGKKEIAFWEVKATETLLCKRLPCAGTGDSPEFFQTLLLRVLDELKTLSVLGAIPPEQLPPLYLANLCLGTLHSLQPLLMEALKGAPAAEGALSSSSLAARSLEKPLLSILRLLVLVCQDRLPTSVHPERLEQAMRFAFGAVPPELRQPLAITAEEPPLPVEAAVRLHHLFRRLMQLPGLQSSSWVSEGLALLLPMLVPLLGGRPTSLPEPVDGKGVLLLFPDRLYRLESPVAEVAAPGFLALTALLRHLTGVPPAALQATDPLSLPGSFSPVLIGGHLPDDGLPTAAETAAFPATLRLSWPTRRFPLPRRTPRWVYRFIHLLGLTERAGSLRLALPGGWLTADYASVLWELIFEQFVLERIELRGDGFLDLFLRKESDLAAVTIFSSEGSCHELPWATVRESHPAMIVLALRTDESVVDRLNRGSLLLPGHAAFPAVSTGELALYARSSWGRYFWQLLATGRTLPAAERLFAEFTACGMPLPAEAFWQRLRQLLRTSPVLDASDFEGELSVWLGSCPSLTPPGKAMRRTTSSDPLGDEQDWLQEVDASVFVDGVPSFPEHYLYDYYRPELADYQFHGPLELKESFFDQFVLQDRDGKVIEVAGEETARALLLVSSGGGDVRVRLPTDRSIMSRILGRYLQDLHGLREMMIRKVQLRVDGREAARQLATRLWQRRSLPPWSLLD